MDLRFLQMVKHDPLNVTRLKMSDFYWSGKCHKIAMIVLKFEMESITIMSPFMSILIQFSNTAVTPITSQLIFERVCFCLKYWNGSGNIINWHISKISNIVLRICANVTPSTMLLGDLTFITNYYTLWRLWIYYHSVKYVDLLSLKRYYSFIKFNSNNEKGYYTWW